MRRTYRGGCHCGAVRFEADLDISAGTVKCNCSICAMARLWSAKAQPDDLRLLRGEKELTDYGFNAHIAHHYFCRRCGIRPFQWVDIPASGSQYYNINLACLEGIDIDELMAAPVTHEDGRNDRWEATPAETRHL